MEANNNTKGIFFIMTGMAFFSIQDSLLNLFSKILRYLNYTLVEH